MNADVVPDATSDPIAPGETRLMLRGIGVDVAGTPLLRGISQILAGGDVLAIVGPSGAGKTRLLRVIVGLDDAAEGSMTLNGQSPAEIGWPAYRRRVTLVSTLYTMLPGTVADNLLAPSSFGGGPPPSKQGQIEALQRVGLSVPLDRDSAVLSTGEQRRVALARAFWMNPDVLVVDEPTNGLDEASARVVEECLTEFSGVVVMVSHNLALTDRIATARLDVAEYVHV
jgi:cobalt/nickel transport system ATP-binding protein